MASFQDLLLGFILENSNFSCGECQLNLVNARLRSHQDDYSLPDISFGDYAQSILKGSFTSVHLHAIVIAIFLGSEWELQSQNFK